MKQCPFCGTKWDGDTVCPGCGRILSEGRDDSLFRRPEADNAGGLPAKRAWEKQKMADQGADTGGTPFQARRLPWRGWQKWIMAAVLLIVAAVCIWSLWPAPCSLPQEMVFFVQDGMVMAFYPGEEPREITEYLPSIEYYLYPGRDGRSFAWINPKNNTLYYQPDEGEAEKIAKEAYSDIRFSPDGQYLYYFSGEGESATTLFQYRIETGETRVVAGSDSYLYYIFCRGRPEVVVWDEEGLSLLDEATLTRQHFLAGEYEVLLSAENGLYFIKTEEEGRSLWRWQQGRQAQLLANSIAKAKIFPDGTGYYQCYTGGTIPLAERVENDLDGEAAEKFFRQLWDIPLQTPETDLYYFDGGQGRRLGENLEMVSFDSKSNSVLVRSARYKQDVSYSLSALEGAEDSWLWEFSQQMTQHWPYESDSAGLLSAGGLFLLPEDFPLYSAGFTVRDGRLCVLSLSEDLRSIDGLWAGDFSGESVGSLYHAQGAESFFLSGNGTVFYGIGPSSETLYEDNVAFEKKVRSESVQMTEDGTLYYLSGSGLSSWTLKSRSYGKTVLLAENVVSCEAFTRDYVLFLQQQEDGSTDVMACVSQGEPELVAEGADMLLRPQNEALGNMQEDYGNG